MGAGAFVDSRALAAALLRHSCPHWPRARVVSTSRHCAARSGGELDAPGAWRVRAEGEYLQPARRSLTCSSRRRAPRSASPQACAKMRSSFRDGRCDDIVFLAVGWRSASGGIRRVAPHVRRHWRNQRFGNDLGLRGARRPRSGFGRRGGTVIDQRRGARRLRAVAGRPAKNRSGEEETFAVF